MPLNSRSKALLVLLLRADGPLTSEDLASRLNLTRRMVRYHLDAAERWLSVQHAALTRKPHYGFEIEATREAKAALLRELKQVTSEDIVLCPQERVHLVLLLLFTQEEPLLVKQLWTQFRVCRSTIFGDLDEAQEWLERHMLHLLRRTNYGFKLMGQEHHIREAFVSLLLEIVDRTQLPILCGSSSLSFSLPPASLPGDLYQAPIESLNSRLSYARTLVNSWESTLEAELTDDAYLSLVLYLAISMDRIAKGKRAEPRPTFSQVWDQRRGRRSSQVIVERMERYLGYKLSDGDVECIELQLNASRMRRSAPIAAIEIAGTVREEPEQYELDLRTVVDAMLDEASAYLHPWLKADQQLRGNLICHLRPAWHRLQAGLSVSNPLLKDIQEYDSYIYQVAKRCADILASEVGKPIPAEEVGFIAMHLAAAMEHVQPQRRRQCRVLVVCGEGSATAWLLVSRLRNEFPDIDITAVKPSRHVSERDLRGADIVVSTCPIDTGTLPSRVVSPLLSAEDVAALRGLLTAERTTSVAVLEALNEWTGPSLSDLITARYVALGVHADDWPGVVDQVTLLLLRAKAVDERYGQAVKETITTHGPYMVSVPGVALLHACPGIGVIRLAMAMLRLDQPVKFGHPENDPVDLVFALAALDNRSHRRALLDLVRIVRDPSVLRALRLAPDVKAVHAILRRVSETTDIREFMPEA